VYVSKLNPEQWAEARRLYAAGQSCAAIARRFGLNAETVRSRVRKEAWLAASATSSPLAPASGKRAKAGARPSAATAGIRAELARRLLSVIAVQIRMKEIYMMKQLEAYQRDDAGIEPPVQPKDQHADFAALIESIKQVTEIDSEPAATADGRRGGINPELTRLSTDIDPDGLAAASEKDAFRRDIAERLGKLLPKP
jgi:transposase-like protein